MEAAAAALSKPQIIVHVEKSLNYTVFDAKWVPCSAKFVVVGSHPRDTGALEVYELSKGELKTVLKVKKCWIGEQSTVKHNVRSITR